MKFPFSSFPFGISMFSIMAILAVTNVHAQQVYKCVRTDGKHQFSDVPCKGTEKTEVIRDGAASVSEQEQREARQRTVKMQEEIVAKEKEKEAEIARRRAEQKREEEIKAGETERDLEHAKRSEVVSDCVRDVARRGASQDIKAEMMAACRGAGTSQRASGISVDSVRECVRNIERTNASEDEKTRQVAVCHGANIEPRFHPYKYRLR
ncbi:MAG: DUF4124 domain-containing protein [Candidatus Accumulibacter sp.]|jgi:chorismate mutase|nr:DUF4124 domain-containing protein [Accumulibacter sp.]